MRADRLTAGQWLGLSVGVLALAALVAIVAAFLAAANLSEARRRLVDRVDPARIDALTLSTAVINQETGVRGFLLGRDEQFLEPYRTGGAQVTVALLDLDRLARSPGIGTLAADIARVRVGIDAWRSEYALPAIGRTRATGAGQVSEQDVAKGNARFDQLRADLRRMQADLAAARADARADLSGAATR